MMYQPIRASRCPRHSGLNSDRSPGRADPPDVLAEVDEHRELGADLDHRGERGARVAPAEQLGEDPQVRAAGDRQELGEALDDAEDDGLEEVEHGAGAYGDAVAASRRARRRRATANLCRMQQRSLGTHRPKVSRLGLGTMTWGRDTDEHEARDQLIAFVEAGGTLLDTAAGYGDGASEELHRHPARRRGRPATRSCSRPRPASRGARGERGHQRLARAPAHAPSTPRCERLGVDHVDLWQVHIWTDETPLEETLAALDYAVTHRAGVVRRRLQLLRLADRPGRDLAARRARPGAAGLDPGGVLPAQPRRRARGAARRRRPSGSACCRGRRWGAGVLTGKYRTGTPSDSRGASPHFAGFVGAYLDDRGRADRRGAWPGPPTAWAGPRSRSRWSGCATGPASPPRSSAPAPPPSSRARSASRSCALPAEIVDALDDVSGG